MIPSGTEIETGIVNALFGGDSGAQQYNLLGQEKAEWFYNKFAVRLFDFPQLVKFIIKAIN